MRTALSLVGWSLMAGIVAACATATPEAATPTASKDAGGATVAGPMEPQASSPTESLMSPVPGGEESLSAPVDTGAGGAARAIGEEELRGYAPTAAPPP